jgi:phage terminase large subunit-like protein
MSKKLPPNGGSGGGKYRGGFLGALRGDWRSIAREEQLAPDGTWTTWIFCAGRGAGKTRSGAEFVQERVETGVGRRIHLIAPTDRDARDVMIEGPAGILACAQPHMRPTYTPSLRKLEWPNGATALLFSSDEPSRLRGPQADTLWIDELCAMRQAQEVLDMSMMGLRLGKDPKCLITTTPRPIKPFRALLDRTGKDVVVTRCSTMANAENLARPFLSQILQQYQGTRLGRQEINAELLTDVPGAMWTLQMLEDTRVNEAPASFQRITIGVDPAGSTAEWADQTGIVASGLGHDGHLYILEDASGSYTPSQWAQVVVDLYHRHRADRVCVERNYGGDMCEAVIRSVDPSVAIKTVTSSRGKVLRCEPIAALWEQKRAHVVGSMPALEDQACNFTHTWDRARDGSPDRLDAMIFGATELMTNSAPGSYFTGPALLGADGQPEAQPPVTQEVFGVLCTTPRTGSAVGFLVVATNPNDLPARFHVMDWKLAESDQALSVEWLRGADARVRELAKEWNALSAPGIMIEADDFGEACFDLAWMHMQTTGEAINLCKIERRRGEPIPTLDQRVEACRAKINSGTVKIARCAVERQEVFRSANANHFMTQVLTFRPEAREASVELVTALCIGVSLWGGGAMIDSPAPSSPPAPPGPPPLPPHIMLRPGAHIVDGAAVVVPGEDGEMVIFPVSPGRHTVDSKIAYAICPEGGITFG